jgi:hypothetical protein
VKDFDGGYAVFTTLDVDQPGPVGAQGRYELDDTDSFVSGIGC